MLRGGVGRVLAPPAKSIRGGTTGQSGMNIMEIVSGDGVNGAIRHCMLLTRELARRGHRLTLVCRSQAWIAGQLQPAGTLAIDAGAETALSSGKSLLPAGVRAVSGTFSRGDTIAIIGTTGREIARGLAGYDADEARHAGVFDERQVAGVTVIEWADRLAGWLPSDRLEVEIEPDPTDVDHRLLRWTATGRQHRALAGVLEGRERP